MLVKYVSYLWITLDKNNPSTNTITNTPFHFLPFFFYVPSFSYRPNYPVEYLTTLLAFESIDKCHEWLEPFGVSFTDLSRCIIDCKNSMSALPNI